ncbi:hypothetical protein F5J12DRAFT_896050 [Pisolithus orientalis]|uniref:uncharacterized protein n=1 Tax=Pisolithus orientalis TaxID=936130 RepID=UPI002225B218|nr:uncharacterized protein F5J12DRAFT_896050 [Pisolithus orientalis]KAI5996914.1 hypothetical protein F5J12DRAFT_896050 [Pisolithus orientalis]
MVSEAPKIEGLFHERAPYGLANVRGWYSLIRNNPLTSDCQVIGVGWYKKRKGAEHEFLRFDISSPDNQHTCIVVAERSGGGVCGPNSDATQAADTLAQTDTAVDATASSLSPPETFVLLPDVGDSTASSADESSPPLDKVTKSDGEKKQKMNTAQIAASFCSGSERYASDRVYVATRISAAGAWVEERPTANELATLLYVTSAQEPKYNHDTQCYWFAATVFDALNILYDGAKQDPIPHQGEYNLWGTGRFQGQRGRGRGGSREKEGQREREQREAAEQERQKEREQRQEAEERARAAQEEIAKLLQEVEALKRAVASTQQA